METEAPWLQKAVKRGKYTLNWLQSQNSTDQVASPFLPAIKCKLNEPTQDLGFLSSPPVHRWRILLRLEAHLFT